MEYEYLQADSRYKIPPTGHIRIHMDSETNLRYIMLVDEGVHLLQERVPSVSAHSLFIKLVEDMKPFTGNTAYVHFGNLAEYFKVSIKSVYRQFKALLDGDILRKVKKGHYLVNPNVVWSGYPKDWKVACTAWGKGETV